MSVISEVKKPGAIAFTWMPCFAQSAHMPFVRFFTNWPSLVDTRMMSSSMSLLLPVTAASMSPDGDGASDTTETNSCFVRLGERFLP